MKSLCYRYRHLFTWRIILEDFSDESSSGELVSLDSNEQALVDQETEFQSVREAHVLKLHLQSLETGVAVPTGKIK